MTENVHVSGPIDINPDSKSRVAYDLTLLIARHEKMDAEKGSRDYWLSLYCQCHKATTGLPLKHILERS
jgi:hypothetical protein